MSSAGAHPPEKLFRCSICPNACYKYERCYRKHLKSEQHASAVEDQLADSAASRADRHRQKRRKASAEGITAVSVEAELSSAPNDLSAESQLLPSSSASALVSSLPDVNEGLPTPQPREQLFMPPPPTLLSGQVEQQYLRPTAAALWDLSMQLSGQQREQLFRTLHSKDFRITDVPHSKQMLHTFLDKRQVWLLLSRCRAFSIDSVAKEVYSRNGCARQSRCSSSLEALHSRQICTCGLT